jgi:hypothetical protein
MVCGNCKERERERERESVIFSPLKKERKKALLI